MVALAGTPNCGKTTLFNHLAGMRHKVANYPGVTVEKRSALVRRGAFEFELVDLPGMYGFSSESLDETVARDFCLRERPDLIIAVLDASNLERGLYLAVQWLELGFPIVIALNMIDEAQALGLRIDVARLSHTLGVPIVPTVARRGEGVEALLEAVVRTVQARDRVVGFELALDAPIDDEISKVADLLEGRDGPAERYPLRWLACKLLEGDASLLAGLGFGGAEDEPLRRQIEAGGERMRGLYGQPPALILARERYGLATQIYKAVVTAKPKRAVTRSDRIDRVLTHPYLGLPLFLLATYLMFEFAFVFGQKPTEWIETSMAWLASACAGALPEGMVRSLVVDGIIGGVGGVIVFVPQIMLLFLAIAVMEDSGYMSRGAAIMDRLMSRVGLHGKSFIPLVLGFGCNVPAIMAARTLENPRDRLVTILVTPMMSCGARLPVYVLFISAFFVHKAPVLFSIYLLGIAMAVLSAILFRRFVFRGSRTPFFMEMPPYRWPSLRTIVRHAWDRAWMYLRKAGTVILMLSVAIWFLSTFPQPPKGVVAKGSERLHYSVAGRVGSLTTPVLRPLGLGDWKVGVALVSGFAAKEVVVATFATLYNVSESSQRSSALRTAMRADPLWTPLSAYALMVFVLLYVPCLSAMVILKRETGSWKWLVFQAVYSTGLAYVAALTVYQVGRLVGLG
jgi:ferrous iron transport protein B